MTFAHIFGITRRSEDDCKVTPSDHEPQQIKSNSEADPFSSRPQSMFIPMWPQHLEGKSSDIDIVAIEPDCDYEAHCELARDPWLWLGLTSGAGFLQGLPEANALCLVLVDPPSIRLALDLRHGKDKVAHTAVAGEATMMLGQGSAQDKVSRPLPVA